MKTLVILLFCVLLVSCASTKSSFHKGSSIESNFALKESFAKVPGDILDTYKVKKEVKSYCELGQFKEGLNKAKQEFHSSQTSNYYNDIANCYYKLGAFTKAIFFIEVAISKDKSNAKAFNTLGNINISLKNYKEALENFKTAKRLAPAMNVPRYNLIKLYTYFHMTDKAKAELRLLQRRSPKDLDLIEVNKMIAAN